MGRIPGGRATIPEDFASASIGRATTLIDTARIRRGTLALFDGLLLMASAGFVIACVILIGFRVEPGLELGLRLATLAVLPLFAVRFAVAWALAPSPWGYLRQHLPDALLALVSVGSGAGLVWRAMRAEAPLTSGFFWSELAGLIIVALQLLAMINLAVAAARANRRIFARSVEPAFLLVGSFALLIFVGTVLLLTPRTTPAGAGLSPLDALFTATSATCVTGLTVVDTGGRFSVTGQAIVLGLIQVGGLGLMSFTAVLALLAGARQGIRERLVLGEILAIDNVAGVRAVLVGVLSFTLLFEGLGALAILPQLGPGDWLAWDRIFVAAFHSVSAFCNAGFSNLPGGSIAPLAQGSGVPLVLLALFVSGGLGFGVLVTVVRRLRPAPPPDTRMIHRRRIRLQVPAPLHYRLVIYSTLALLALGTGLILAVEWSGPAMEGLSAGRRLEAAFFHSASTRTAGFAYLPVVEFSDATLLLFCVLMFIGASPGGTGGGVKTTTILVQLASMRSILRRRNEVEILGRTLPRDLVSRAVAVVLSAAGLVLVSTFLLTLVEDVPFLSLLFEATSAVATTGLSTGITPDLSNAGKVILIFDMFLGRVGPLTLFLLLGRPRRGPEYRFPNERVLIG